MEKRVIVEDCEEEEDDDNFHGFAEYGAFSDTTMGEAKDEAAEDKRTNDLGQFLTCVMLIKTTKVKMSQRNSSAC